MTRDQWGYFAVAFALLAIVLFVAAICDLRAARAPAILAALACVGWGFCEPGR